MRRWPRAWRESPPDVNLGLIQPASMFRRGMHSQAAPERRFEFITPPARQDFRQWRLPTNHRHDPPLLILGQDRSRSWRCFSYSAPARPSFSKRAPIARTALGERSRLCATCGGVCPVDNCRSASNTTRTCCIPDSKPLISRAGIRAYGGSNVHVGVPPGRG